MEPTLTSRRSRMRIAVVAVAATALFALAGVAADKHDHHDDHDHDHDHKPPATSPAAGKKEEEGHHHDEVKLTAEAVKKNGIRVEPVKPQQLKATITVPARVSFNANAMAHVGSAVKGRVAELKVQVGDTVAKDDVLLVVESAELGEAQVDYIQKRGAKDAAAPLVESAQGAYDRAKQLYEQTKGISLTELQKRETEFKTAQATLQAATTAATAAQNKLHLYGMDQAAIDALIKSGQIHPRFAVRAPIAGQVTEREVTLGELVSPEREHLLVIADMSKLWVLADVPEAMLKDLTKGAEAHLTLAALPEETVKGTVAFVAQTVDSATHTAKVRIEVSHNHLKPGMFASAEIEAGGGEKAEPVLAVPDDAVQTVEGGPAVFVPVEGEENTFEKRAITVGKRVGIWVPVLSGLKAGEAIVVSGSFVLKADLGKSGASHHH